MSRTTSAGVATVRQLCRAFRISREAFYAAQKVPRIKTAPRERQGSWVLSCELMPRIEAIAAEEPAWGVRKVWARLRRETLLVSQKRDWRFGAIQNGPTSAREN